MRRGSVNTDACQEHGIETLAAVGPVATRPLSRRRVDICLTEDSYGRWC